MRSFLLACAVLAASDSIARAQTIYSITDLGASDSLGFYSVANGISRAGQVVGYAPLPGEIYPKAFLYAGGAVTILPTFGGDFGYANGIAPSLPTRVVGQASTADQHFRGFLYAGGVLTDLGTLGGSLSLASGINDSGLVIGYSKLTGDLYTHGFLWANGTMTDLGTLGGPNSVAFGINSGGDIVGGTYRADYSYTAFLYRSGTMTDLPGLGGSESQANAINDAGLITGFIRRSPATANAFLYDHGVVTDIPTLGGAFAQGRSINNRGDIVGQASDQLTVQHAFLFTNGALVDLTAALPAGSGWLALTDATDINDAGQIVGYGYTTTGDQHAFLIETAPPVGSSFYTLPPCRVFDTRGATGPLGGPALNAGAVRAFPIAQACGIPAGARAVAGNVTVTQPSSAGHLTVYPSDAVRPLASTINFAAGATRANNGVFALSASGQLSVFAGHPVGTVHVILDVVGYFQ